MSEVPTMYDEALSGILHNEGQITRFLDVVLGFLHRKTDFFMPRSADAKTGFLPGAGFALLRDTFRTLDKFAQEKRMKASPIIPMIQIEDAVVHSPKTDEIRSVPSIVSHLAEDPGNGAVHDRYSWNQTSVDLDLKVTVPKYVIKSKQLEVSLSRTAIKVCVKGHDPLIEGKFFKPINSAESMWILIPGEYVQISLDKTAEGWWESVVEGDGKIDLTKLNAEVSLNDFPCEEKQTIRKLMDEQKSLDPHQPHKFDDVERSHAPRPQ